MKAKYVISAFLAISGLLVMTYAQTRYHTSKILAAEAQSRMNEIIEKDGLYKIQYPEGLPSRITHAMHSIGGRYNWHNEGQKYTGYGAMLIILAYVVARTSDRSKKNGQQAAPSNR